MEAIQELERASAILMAPPGAVSTEERHNAEQLFLQYRKTKNPYDLCQKILQTCKVDYVLFEAATTIKEAIIREWTILKKEEIDSVCSFLLHCATENLSLQNYVREQILQVVAIIFKLGTLDNPEARTSLVNGLTQLLSHGDRTMELICCSIMKALLTEYSTTSQSTNFGMSLDFHANCKRSFEEKDLLNIFVLTVQTLQKFMNVEMSGLSRQDIAVFIRYLSLAEQVLHWEFMSGHPLSLLRFPGSNETAQKIIFRPHKNWKEVMLDPNLLDLVFKLLSICVNNSELSHHCMQCLVQLASMAGSVFKSDELHLKYLDHYVTRLLAIINCHKWNGHQAFGLSNILFRLLDVFPIKIIKSISQHNLSTLFEAMTYLTCTFQEAAINSNDFDFDDNEYLEAANLLLDAWITVIAHAEDFPPGFFVQYSLKIIDIYLKTHLASPDGIRKPESEYNNMDEIEYDIVEDDRDACADELSNIGHLARQCLPRVVPVLIDKLETRLVHLKEYYQHEKLKLSTKTANDSRVSDALFEDIHWLLLICSFVLTIDNSGESPQIPTEVINFTNVSLTTNTRGVGESVKYLVSLGKEGLRNDVDPIVALLVTILKVVEVEMEFLRNGLIFSFSPEVASTMLWFLKRWTKGYFSLHEASDTKLSPTLIACFDLKHDCGKFLIKLLLDVVELNLNTWTAEPQVSEDVVKLLLRLINQKKRAEICLTFPNVWNIVQNFSSRTPEICALSPLVHRHLVECLMRACSQMESDDTKQQLQTQLLQPILTQYQAVRSKENFNRISHDDVVKNEVIRTFECVRGIAKGSIQSNANFLFKFTAPILEDSLTLLNVYSNYTEVIVCVLEMFVDVVDGSLCLLNQENSTAMCNMCLRMMENYSKFNLGKTVLGSSEEEEKYYDLLLLIQLLTHILSKDYLDFSESSTLSNGQPAVSPVDVVLFGFHLIIPLINQELMKYPKLSGEYFKLVTFVCEVYPEKIKCLPLGLFQNFMASIQMAISDYGADSAKCSLDALSSLAKYYCNECDKNDESGKILFEALREFLNIVFQHIVLGQFNMDLIEPSAEALFLLICCHQEEYLKLANNLIAQQHVTDESFKQKLIEAFQVLTPSGLQLTPNRQSLKQFRKNLEIFLQNVKGFLCFK